METSVVTNDKPNFDGLIVEFFVDAVFDERATNGWVEERYNMDTGEMKKVVHPGAGRDIYRDAEWIEIRIPGNVLEIRKRLARPSDLRKFPREYAAFKAGLTEAAVGTPLDKLPFLSPAQVKEFKAIGLKTAENIRDISDGDGQKIMNFQGLKKRVCDFLDAAAGNAPTLTLRTELEKRDAEIAALKAQMAEVVKHSEKKGK